MTLAGRLTSIAALLVFVWLGAEVLRGGTQSFDDYVRSVVHAHASAAVTGVMRAISLAGQPAVLIALGVPAVALVLRSSGQRTVVAFVVTVLGAEGLEQLLKLVFHRQRPVVFFGLAEPAGYSFPSGHAVVSCAFFGALVVFAARRRWWHLVAAAVPVAAIGVSRIYLGMHYPSDVLGGWAAAVFWVSTVVWARRLPRLPKRTPPALRT